VQDTPEIRAAVQAMLEARREHGRPEPRVEFLADDDKRWEAPDPFASE
jgi:hypothetical protein